MRRILIGVTGWLVCLVALVLARQSTAPPPPPTFRASVDLVELDVSALDKDRHPVRGLTQGDFTVTIDGQTRRVVAFKAVDLPAPVTAPSATWMRDVAPDVATNTHPSGRVVAIVIDDGSFPYMSGNTTPVYVIQETRKIAHAAVDSLGPDDLAAVVFTENNHSAQDFTTDRGRLQAAIDKAALIPSPVQSQDPNDANSRPSPSQGQGPNGANTSPSQVRSPKDGNTRGECYCGLCSIEALQHVAESLRSLPQQRKVVMYVSLGLPVTTPAAATVEDPSGSPLAGDACNQSQREGMEHVFEEAALSNVTIESVDLEGLTAGGDTLKTEFLRTMAENTGGRAVVNINDAEREVPALLDESRSYYLLGVERPPTKDNGRPHPIKVNVDRPGVEVRTRNSYYAPTAKEMKALAAGPSHTIDAAVADAVAKSDFPLEAAVAPFMAGKGKAALAIVLNVSQSNLSATAHQEPVNVVVRTFNPETGNALGTWRQSVNLVWKASASATGEYELLSLVPITPGRYELRIGVQAGDVNTASVYAYAEVPKFSDEPLSLSGMEIEAAPSPKSAPRDAFKDLLPIVPTARRTFQKTDHVRAFLRIYQGGSRAIVPATITTYIVDSHDQKIGNGSRQVAAADFSKTRSFDYGFELPTRLPPGEYLLKVDVAAGSNTAERTMRFQVQ